MVRIIGVVILVVYYYILMAVLPIVSNSTGATTISEATEPGTATNAYQLPAPGRMAPDFHLQNLEGEEISLSDYRGSPLVLNFWASWCGPCRYEMPFFQEVYEDMDWQVTGLVILTVNAGESISVAGRFMNENGFTFPVLLDETSELSIRYNIRGLPTTFFIDESGIIKYIAIGAFSSKLNLEQKLYELLE